MKLLIILCSFLISHQLMAYGTGMSVAPMVSKQKFITAEFTGITSTDGGVGVQARYTQKVTPAIVLDAGIGVGGGERSDRIFVGADYTFFPDYGKQPRISAKLTYANAKEFDNRINIISISPTVSKGFNFWGKEAYPFIAIPYSLNLNSERKKYETSLSANVGIVGKVPFQGYDHLTMSLEGIIKIDDSYSGVFVGLSYPLD